LKVESSIQGNVVPGADPSRNWVDRLSLWQRWEHGLMSLSVLLLVLSGMALAYHEQAWAQWLIRLMGGIAGRQKVHRVAAFGLLAAGILHFLGLLLSARHRRDFRHILLRTTDFHDMWRGVRFALSGAGEAPRYGWFTPMQKIQYWGVMIGCLIMGISGVLLWSPVTSLTLFPKWVFDIMLVIHAKEPQLLFVAFIIWHLYDVHVAGGNFPMNPAWLTGKMPVKTFSLQHQETSDPAHHASVEEKS